MASIIIHLDTNNETTLRAVHNTIENILGLLPEQSIVRSSTYAPQDLTDAAFDNRLDDVLDYARELSRF